MQLHVSFLFSESARTNFPAWAWPRLPYNQRDVGSLIQLSCVVPFESGA